MDNIKVDLETGTYGREAKVYVTARQNGQYYFAEIKDGRICWTRQVHQAEVKPIFIESPKLILQIARGILNLDDNSCKEHL